MRILDKHMVKSLAAPLACCLTAFTMVFVVFDLFNHLDNFIQGGAGLASVLVFYAWTLPTATIYISPVSMFLATLYSLTQMTKNNELTAMRSCGVSLPRIAIPVLLIGAALSSLTAVVNETLAPNAQFRTRQFIRIQQAEDKRMARMAPHLAFRNVAERRSWWIGHLDTVYFDLFDVQITEMSPEGLDLRKIQADRATWTDGRWWFHGVVIRDYDDLGSLRGAGRRSASLEMSELTETPEDFLTLVKDKRFLSARELRSYRRAHPSLSDDEVTRLKVDYHSRLAMPWMTLIVTFLGISFGHQTARKGALVGILLALGLFFGFWLLTHLGVWAGKEALLPPVLAGWGPNAIFLSLGVWLLARIQ